MKRQKELELAFDKNLYYCTRDGKIISTFTGKPRKPRLKTKGSDAGYSDLGLTIFDNYITLYVHQVVFCFFNRGVDMSGKEVNHKDGNKQNNDPDNLELVTNLQNVQHANAMGLIDHTKSSPLTHQQVKEIKVLLNEGKLNCSRIAKMYNIKNPNVIYQIKKGKTWKQVA